MKHILEKLKEMDILEDSDINAISESFEQQKEETLAQAKKELEESIRQEYAEKYRADHDALISATEEMIASSLSEHFAQNEQRINELSELKSTLENTAFDYQKSLATKLKESVKASEAFFESIVKNHLNEFQSDVDAVETLRIKAAKAINEAQDFYKAQFIKEQKSLRDFTVKKLQEQMTILENKSNHLDRVKSQLIENARELNKKRKKELNEHLKAFDKAAVKRLYESIRDLNDERQQVANTRVAIVTEGRERIALAEKQLVKRFAKSVDHFTTTALVENINELKNEIADARKNRFGEKVFESFVSEFLSSHFSDGTQTKQLMESLKQKDNEIKLLESQVKESKNKLLQESQQRKVIQDNAERQQVMNSLLSTLNGNKRETMRNLLETVKTDKLKEKFNGYLVQLNEQKVNIVKKPQTLIETTVVTGDNKNSPVITDDDEEMKQILRRAGI
jgi:hypothetical protein